MGKLEEGASNPIGGDPSTSEPYSPFHLEKQTELPTKYTNCIPEDGSNFSSPMHAFSPRLRQFGS